MANCLLIPKSEGSLRKKKILGFSWVVEEIADRSSISTPDQLGQGSRCGEGKFKTKKVSEDNKVTNSVILQNT